MLLRSMLQSVTVLTGIVKRWVPLFEGSECLFACQCGSAYGLRHDVAGTRRVDAGSRRSGRSVDLPPTSACLSRVRSSNRVEAMFVSTATRRNKALVLSCHRILGGSPFTSSSSITTHDSISSATPIAPPLIAPNSAFTLTSMLHNVSRPP